ncbi:hypothetical protein CL617_05705 [archaeon]|nr:hypothetical protein [archaeon]|tara:strand:- start:1134 stop:1796 length:663 start_codon:yes stop_codon:yes gene_type:complete
MPNLYVITGSHGSGKTTFIKKVKEELGLRNILFAAISETARFCPHPVGSKSTPIAQQWILYHQAFAEVFSSQFSLPVILDRCVVDHYAYYLHWNSGPKINLESNLKNYEKVFMLPANEDFLVADGLRPTDIDYQKKIDGTIRKIHRDLGKLYYNIEEIDPFNNECIETVVDEIERYTPKASLKIRFPKVHEICGGKLDIASYLTLEGILEVMKKVVFNPI